MSTISNLPEYSEGLGDLQEAYLYSKKKQKEEQEFKESLRPNKKQSTLKEY